MTRTLVLLVCMMLATGPTFAGDTAWKAATASFVASSYADLRTTELGLDRGASEISPLMPSHPSDTRLYGQNLALTTGAWLWARHLKERGNRRAALMILWVVSAARVAAAIHNDGVARH